MVETLTANQEIIEAHKEQAREKEAKTRRLKNDINYFQGILENIEIHEQRMRGEKIKNIVDVSLSVTEVNEYIDGLKRKLDELKLRKL